MTWSTAKGPKPRKFIPGELLLLNDDALLEIALSHKWFFHGARLTHSAALKNMSLTVVRASIERGCVRRADLNPDWVEYERERFSRLDKASQIAIAGAAA